MDNVQKKLSVHTASNHTYYRHGQLSSRKQPLGIMKKLGYLLFGAMVGTYMGAVVVVGQIQSSVQPVVTQDSDSTLEVSSTMAGPGNLQPAIAALRVQGNNAQESKSLQ